MESRGVKLYDLINYSGIMAFIFLVTTIVFGITGANYKVHKVVGIVTFAFAVLHVGLVVHKTIKVKLKRR